MKKSLWIVLAVVAVLAVWGYSVYNVAVRRFPANLVAGILSFGQKPYFEADDSAAQAPEVTF